MVLSRIASVVVPVALGAFLASGAFHQAFAADIKSFVISPNDGYGLQDCLATRSDCGQVVADAFCEAHGRGVALSFGPQSLFTEAATRISTADEPYVINCGD